MTLGPMLLLAFAARAEPVTYVLRPADSALYTVVYYERERRSLVPAHDHTVVATTFDGTVRWDGSDPSSCAIDISFPVNALAIDPPGFREREGLSASGAVGENTKRIVVHNMTGAKNLDAAHHPRITFHGTVCEAQGADVRVTGTLEIRGVARPVEVSMAIDADGRELAARGGLWITHAEFGMTPYTYGPLTPRNDERLKLVVDVVGEVRDPE